MTDHLEDHHFYCGECLLPFTCPFLVPIHFQLEHEFRCACDRIFSDKVELLIHIENVGCRFPFSVEVSKPEGTRPSTTDQRSKVAISGKSLANGAFDAVSSCIRKTDDGFSCSICEKISVRRYRLWQHVKKSHGEVVKKMAYWHLKTVFQKYSAMVGEALTCVLCGKPYLKQCNFYEHFCIEHTLEMSQITVDPAKVEEQNMEEFSTVTVLRNRFYTKVNEGKYRCLICRRCCNSLRAITRHLRQHGKKLKECLDKSVMGATVSRQKTTSIRSSRNDFSDKYNVENVKSKTEYDSSGLNQKSHSGVRSEVVVKRPEQELEFLRGYIAKKEAFYYCQLCPAKSRKKGYLYQHLTIRHDDILGETLSTFRPNEANVFEHKDTSESIDTPVAQYGDTGTHSLGNVVGNVEFHTDVWTSENKRYKTTVPVLLSESCDEKPQESQSVSDTSVRRLAVSQDAHLEHVVHAADYGRVNAENTDTLSSASATNFPSATVVISLKRRPSLQPACSDGGHASDGQSGDAVGSRLGFPFRKKPKRSPPKSPAFNCASEVAKAFCPKTRTYVCSICNHTLISKSGWYKHFKQCKVGNICGRQKRSSSASKHSESGDQIRVSESAAVDSQRGSDPPAVPETANVKKKGRNGQKMWKCVACQCQFTTHARWQRHFTYCKRKRLMVRRKYRRYTRQEEEYLRKNCHQKGQKFACRICGLDYLRISDAFYHIRKKHGMGDVAGGDDNGFKLNSGTAQSALNRSRSAKVKSEVKSSERKKAGPKIGVVNSGLKSTLAEAVLKRRAYVQSQILEENGRSHCQVCGKSFLLRNSARKHVNSVHLGPQIVERPPAARVSPDSHYVKNVASTKVNRLRVKVLYKPRNKSFTNGTKAFMNGAKLKTEVGSASFVKSCGLCSKRFLSLRSLTTHITSEHMTIETTPFPCVMCHRNFDKRQYCVRHFVHTHCLGVKVGKKFRCKICDIYFPNKTCRLQHLSEVHADVCEVCSICSAIFLTRQDLQKHVRAIHSANISDVSEGQISKDALQNEGSSKD